MTRDETFAAFRAWAVETPRASEDGRFFRAALVDGAWTREATFHSLAHPVADNLIGMPDPLMAITVLAPDPSSGIEPITDEALARDFGQLAWRGGPPPDPASHEALAAAEKRFGGQVVLARWDLPPGRLPVAVVAVAPSKKEGPRPAPRGRMVRKLADLHPDPERTKPRRGR